MTTYSTRAASMMTYLVGLHLVSKHGRILAYLGIPLGLAPLVGLQVPTAIPAILIALGLVGPRAATAEFKRIARHLCQGP